jgi:hypothetical protein
MQRLSTRQPTGGKEMASFASAGTSRGRAQARSRGVWGFPCAIIALTLHSPRLLLTDLTLNIVGLLAMLRAAWALPQLPQLPLEPVAEERCESEMAFELSSSRQP